MTFSINRALSGASDVKELIDSITSVKSTFNNQVEIKTDGPNPILLNQLSQIFIMSEAWSKKMDVSNLKIMTLHKRPIVQSMLWVQDHL